MHLDPGGIPKSKVGGELHGSHRVMKRRAWLQEGRAALRERGFIGHGSSVTQRRHIISSGLVGRMRQLSCIPAMSVCSRLSSFPRIISCSEHETNVPLSDITEGLVLRGGTLPFTRVSGRCELCRMRRCLQASYA